MRTKIEYYEVAAISDPMQWVTDRKSEAEYDLGSVVDLDTIEISIVGEGDHIISHQYSLHAVFRKVS
jgi:hypothetical protein